MTFRQRVLQPVLPVIFVLSVCFMVTACERKMPDTGNEPESSPKPQVQVPTQQQQRPSFRRHSNRTVLVLVRQIHAPARIRC